MKSLKILFLLAILMAALANSLSATPSQEVQLFNTPSSESEEPTSLRGANRFLRHHHRYSRSRGVKMTCNEYPRVCRAPGSKGPDCCKKMCVNVSTDRNNCGKCGKKCKYSQMCCRGKCVNPMFSNNHCGSCGNKCQNGNSCVYGICNYA